MQIDLKALTRKELEKLKTDIDKALAKVTAREKKAALAAVERAAKAHGFTLADITGTAETPAKPKRKAPKKPAARGKPKYANPDDRKQTWTGKGRKPDWFNAALAAGKTPTDMAL